jgi:ABC-type transport system involved in cytochrome bd biosynthesis fused ATPase/permease subunit
VTFLVTLLSFAVCLLASIVGAVVYSRVKGVPVSLTSAHGIIAVPVALTIGAVVLVLVLVIEIRSYRQAKALTAIERASRDVPG